MQISYFVEKNNTKNFTNLENIQLKEFVFNLQHTLQDWSGFKHNKHLKDKTLVNIATSFLCHFWLRSLLSFIAFYTILLDYTNLTLEGLYGKEN